ncbi:MAG: AAA family ATPase [Candidatus Thorarchaeota archaeon]
MTISGPHGTGKSSVARMLSERLGLRYVSAGELFRRLAAERKMSLEDFSRVAEQDDKIDRALDEGLREEAARGDAVIDAQLGAWMAEGYADINILLTAPLEVRVRRIAMRDGTDYHRAYAETISRENSERERYRRYYGIDLRDMSRYDLILNTGKYDLDAVVDIVTLAIKRYVKPM